MKTDNYLLLTLGGVGQRFLDSNITQPKFLLNYQQKTILQNILETFSGNFFLIVGLNEVYIKFINEIEEIIKKSAITSFQIIKMQPTNSQAETAFETLKQFKIRQGGFEDNPLYIINGDTIGDMKDLDMISNHMKVDKNYGGIEYFYSESENFSYIAIDNKEDVINIEEKLVISNNATTGFYGFNSVYLYNDYYKKALIEFKNNKQKFKEMYISFIYKQMIVDGKTIKAFKTRNNPVILGTPEEYFHATSS